MNIIQYFLGVREIDIIKITATIRCTRTTLKCGNQNHSGNYFASRIVSGEPKEVSHIQSHLRLDAHARNTAKPQHIYNNLLRSLLRST